MIELDEVRSATLADGVENSLLKFIHREGLTPGDLLPKEEDLADKMRVSRHIVREGISRLKTWGLIESRKRKGMILSRPNVFAGVSKLAAAQLFNADECNQLMGMRAVMELGMAEFIYNKKTPELIADLRKFAGKEQSYQDFSEEIEFHTRLFAIGGNHMASQFQQIVTTAFYSYLNRSGNQTNQAFRTPTHQEICDALEHGTRAQFTRLLREHFKPYTNW